MAKELNIYTLGATTFDFNIHPTAYISTEGLSPGITKNIFEYVYDVWVTGIVFRYMTTPTNNQVNLSGTVFDHNGIPIPGSMVNVVNEIVSESRYTFQTPLAANTSMRFSLIGEDITQPVNLLFLNLIIQVT